MDYISATMGRQRHFIIILITVLMHAVAVAQTGLIATRYSVDNGLPTGIVNTTVKDRDGFVWLGTWYGLSSFDGTEFNSYVVRKNPKSDIPPRKVISIVEDRRNSLWIRTSDNRLYRFDKTTETFNDMYSELRKVASNLKVIKIQTIDNGNTLIYTRDKNLYEIRVDEDNSPHIRKIYDARHDIDRSTMRLKRNVVGETGRYLFWLGPDFEVGIVSKGSKVSKISILRNVPDASSATTFSHYGRTVYIGTASGNTYAINADNGRVVKLRTAGCSAICTINRIGSRVFTSTNSGIYCDGKLLARLAGGATQSYADSRGKLWIYGRRSGLTLFDPSDNSTRNFPTPAQTVLDAVKFCDAGANGMFFLLRNETVWRFDRNTGTMQNFNPQSFVGADLGAMPFAIGGGGQATKFVDIDIDSDGLLWLSSSTDGLFKVRFPRDLFTFLYPDMLAADVNDTNSDYGIRSLYQAANGDIWIGTRHRTLYCVDGRSGALKKKFENLAANIYNIMVDRSGCLWLSSKGGGLIMGTPDRSAPQGIRFTPYRHDARNRYSISHDNVYYSYQDSRGRIWVCTYGGGLNLISRQGGKTIFINKNNRMKRYPHNDLYINARQIVEDNNHTMWVATTDGLLSFDGSFKNAEGIVFNNFRRGKNHTVVDNDVLNLLKDHKGNIWISVFGCGVNKIEGYDATSGNLRLYAVTGSGQSGNMVSTLVEDKRHRLWFTAENGLSSLAETGSTLNTYGHLDGFQSSKVEDNATICLKDGRILVGSRLGVIAYSPDRVEHEGKRSYPIFIVDFKVQNRSLASFTPPISEVSPRYAKEITLTHDQDMFSIEFSALNFGSNDATTFTYILDGYEKHWHMDDESRVASYANIPPGEYIFRVKSAEGNSPERTLRITILPPWWATWWAYCIYFILLCAAVYGGIRLSLTMLRMRNEVYISNRLAELKIRFFTNISHELRTPLTLIKSPITSLIRNEKLSAEGKEYLRLIDRNATKMLHLVNQILDFRKVQNGKMPLHLSHTDICDIMRIFHEEYRMAAKDRNIKLEFNLPQEPLMAWCDAEKIGVILNNLISNAFKYTHTGGEITVSASYVNNSTSYAIDSTSHAIDSSICRIRVEDNGATIPEGQLEKIFDRFAMADNATPSDTQQTGTGIGLSLSREYAIMHHGRIWAENLPDGGGAAFTLEIPTNKEAYANDLTEILLDDNTAKAEGKKETTEESDGQAGISEGPDLSDSSDNSGRSDKSNLSRSSSTSPTLVLIEDNSDLRRLLTMQLSQSYRVIPAEDGVDGLEKILSSHPDLIITDLMMPRMDGVELLRRVRKDFTVSHVPVIILTAKNGDEEKTRAIANGANAFITKPFSQEMLMARIHQLLQEQSVFQRKMILQQNHQATESDSAADEYEKHLARKDMEFITRIRSFIEENIQNEDFNIDTIAGEIGLSRSAFFKKLKSLTGYAPIDLVREIRLDKAEKLIATTSDSVSEIAYKVGFKEASYFGKCFKKKFGMTPLEYRNRNTKKQDE